VQIAQPQVPVAALQLAKGKPMTIGRDCWIPSFVQPKGVDGADLIYKEKSGGASI
jgi:hypothetical protein